MSKEEQIRAVRKKSHTEAAALSTRIVNSKERDKQQIVPPTPMEIFTGLRYKLYG
jgi:hypothetical protein